MYAAIEPFGGAGADERQQWALYWHAAFSGTQRADKRPWQPETFASPWAVPPLKRRERAPTREEIRAFQAQMRDQLNAFTPVEERR